MLKCYWIVIFFFAIFTWFYHVMRALAYMGPYTFLYCGTVASSKNYLFWMFIRISIKLPQASAFIEDVDLWQLF